MIRLHAGVDELYLQWRLVTRGFHITDLERVRSGPGPDIWVEADLRLVLGLLAVEIL
jgi:hypothetical protein